MKEYSAKAQATREKILRAANDLFYEHGFNAAGVDRIIAEAGVTKGNFFYHFKNKEELATAVLDWHRELAFAEVGLEKILASRSPAKALLALLRGMASRMTGGKEACSVRGCFFGNFALELSTGSEPVRHKVQEIFGGIRMLIQDLIEKAQAKGEVRKDLDAQKTAGLILGLMEGAVLLDKTNQTEKEVQHAVKFIADYLMV